jgi:hypothetical protein
MISIYGNCQSKEIHNMLSLSKNFTEKYGTESYIAMNFVFIKEFNPIDEIIENFKKTDLLIYQPLPEKHYPYSTSHLLEHLPKDCVKISFPYIFNDALWGYPVDGNYKDAVDGDFVLSNQYENSLDRFNYNLDITREKEKSTVLKISNFINENYREMELFYTQNHLNPVVVKELCRQVLEHLEIENDLDDIDLNTYQTGYSDFRWPITQKAKQQFGFKYQLKYPSI